MSLRARALVPMIAGALLCGCSAPATQSTPNREIASDSTITQTEAPSDSADRAPSAAQLDEMVRRALDPAVPAAAKTSLVQGATDADAPLFDELVRLRRENPDFAWHIGKPVLEQPGVAKAPVSGLVSGVNQTAYATVVFDGAWKLQRAYACQIVAQVGRTTPSCR